MTIDKTAIRNAATVIVVRDRNSQPSILMGQRGSKAAFMPNKFVFPGGALDADDHAMAAAGVEAELAPSCARRLAARAPEGLGLPLALAAIRETWEETGLRIGKPDPEAAARMEEAAPADWKGFFAHGAAPAPEALTFVFRAITPPFRPRRFDARFFLADAATVIENLQTTYRVGKGMLDHILELEKAKETPEPQIAEAEGEAPLNPARAEGEAPAQIAEAEGEAPLSNPKPAEAEGEAPPQDQEMPRPRRMRFQYGQETV